MAFVKIQERKRHHEKKWRCLIVIGFLSVLCVTSSSCQSNKNKSNSISLTVITDPSIRKEVEDVANFMEEISEVKIKLNVLPSMQSERDAEIQKLRTKIMSGKGADVYLMDTNEDAAEIKTELFENPYKSMQSGVFASLDKYMDKDSYWKDSTYNTSLLTAGQYEGKQYILPLSCYYYVFSGETLLGDEMGNNLEEWMAYAKTSSDPRIRATLGRAMYLAAGRWFQPAVDYKKKTVKFDKEKWKTFAGSYLQLCQETMQEDVDLTDSSYQFGAIRSYHGSNIAFAHVMPDLEGRKMASVMTYGAVGMNSEHKKEAYRFLMLFLNSEMQENKGVTEIFKESVGMTVQQNKISDWLFDRSEKEILQVEESFKELDGAYFITNVEKNLLSNIRKTVEYGVEPAQGWEKYASNLADQIWHEYEISLKE